MLRALLGPGSGLLIKKGNSVLRPPNQVLQGEVAPAQQQPGPAWHRLELCD